MPAISTVFLGMSFTLVFISFLSYLSASFVFVARTELMSAVECYLMYSASALAANTIVRSAVGAAFPLFTDQMYVPSFPLPAALTLGGAGSRSSGSTAPVLSSEASGSSSLLPRSFSTSTGIGLGRGASLRRAWIFICARGWRGRRGRRRRGREECRFRSGQGHFVV